MAVRIEIEIERTIRPRQGKIVGRAKKEQRREQTGGMISLRFTSIKSFQGAGAAEGRMR
jgi:hypothetical protein